MMLNEGGQLLSSCKFHNKQLANKILDIERKDLIFCDDYHNPKSEKGSKDIADLLPDDPFDMEFEADLHHDPFPVDIDFILPRDPFGMDLTLEATVSAITGWMEDSGLRACAIVTTEEIRKIDDDKLLGELSTVWTSSLEFELEEEENENFSWSAIDLATQSESELSHGECDDVMRGNENELLHFRFDENCQEDHAQDDYSNANGEAPAEALLYALSYLDIQDLLSVEMVCKSLRDAVQKDPILWQNIHIDYPLSFKIMDDDLLRLTNRAQGSLSSLSLIRCRNITNVGLKRIFESNLRLTKLSMPGCIKINADEFLEDMKVFNSVCMPGIKFLRVSDNFGITNQHLEEFNRLLRTNDLKKAISFTPRYYHAGELYLPLEDEHPIDIETCPKCQEARQVYDCPVKSCQEGSNSAVTCRACILCTDRCISCGCCLDNTDYEETVYLDSICLDCLSRLLDSQSTGEMAWKEPVRYSEFFLVGSDRELTLEDRSGASYIGKKCGRTWLPS